MYTLLRSHPACRSCCPRTTLFPLVALTGVTAPALPLVLGPVAGCHQAREAPQYTRMGELTAEQGRERVCLSSAKYQFVPSCCLPLLGARARLSWDPFSSSTARGLVGPAARLALFACSLFYIFLFTGTLPLSRGTCGEPPAKVLALLFVVRFYTGGPLTCPRVLPRFSF